MMKARGCITRTMWMLYQIDLIQKFFLQLLHNLQSYMSLRRHPKIIGEYI